MPRAGEDRARPARGRIPEPSVAVLEEVGDGSEAKSARAWWGDEGKGHFFVNVAAPTYQTFRLPDPIDTVFELELE